MKEQDVDSSMSEEEWVEDKKRVLDEIEARTAERDRRIAESEFRLNAFFKDRLKPEAVKVEPGAYDNYEVEVPPKKESPVSVLPLE